MNKREVERSVVTTGRKPGYSQIHQVKTEEFNADEHLIRRETREFLIFEGRCETRLIETFADGGVIDSSVEETFLNMNTKIITQRISRKYFGGKVDKERREFFSDRGKPLQRVDIDYYISAHNNGIHYSLKVSEFSDSYEPFRCVTLDFDSHGKAELKIKNPEPEVHSDLDHECLDHE
jgi:hypothetical protein